MEMILYADDTMFYIPFYAHDGWVYRLTELMLVRLSKSYSTKMMYY